MRVWIKHAGQDELTEYEADELLVSTPVTITTEYSQLSLSEPEAGDDD